MKKHIVSVVVATTLLIMPSAVAQQYGSAGNFRGQIAGQNNASQEYINKIQTISGNRENLSSLLNSLLGCNTEGVKYQAAIKSCNTAQALSAPDQVLANNCKTTITNLLNAINACITSINTKFAANADLILNQQELRVFDCLKQHCIEICFTMVPMYGHGVDATFKANIASYSGTNPCYAITRQICSVIDQVMNSIENAKQQMMQLNTQRAKDTYLNEQPDLFAQQIADLQDLNNDVDAQRLVQQAQQLAERVATARSAAEVQEIVQQATRIQQTTAAQIQEAQQIEAEEAAELEKELAGQDSRKNYCLNPNLCFDALNAPKKDVALDDAAAQQETVRISDTLETLQMTHAIAENFKEVMAQKPEISKKVASIEKALAGIKPEFATLIQLHLVVPFTAVYSLPVPQDAKHCETLETYFMWLLTDYAQKNLNNKKLSTYYEIVVPFLQPITAQNMNGGFSTEKIKVVINNLQNSYNNIEYFKKYALPFIKQLVKDASNRETPDAIIAFKVESFCTILKKHLPVCVQKFSKDSKEGLLLAGVMNALANLKDIIAEDDLLQNVLNETTTLADNLIENSRRLSSYDDEVPVTILW